MDGWMDGWMNDSWDLLRREVVNEMYIEIYTVDTFEQYSYKK